jgi:1-pyrroline-5-carboxylate dehydrogenase
MSKNPFEAEFDAIGESVDNMRYAGHFMSQIFGNQPYNSYEALNHVEYRPLEGFIYVITPFNFFAIGSFGNTCTIAAGNTTIWKMSADILLPAYYLMKIYKEAGLPDGVINFLPGSGKLISDVALRHKDFAGCAFVGSNETFNAIWKEVANNIENYKNFPKLSGETGGKAFCFLHPSADVEAAAVAIIRGGYSYQGQKCGSCTRVYCPESLWPKLKTLLGDMIGEIKTGDPRDFGNYHNALIDKEAFDRVMGFIEHARNSNEAEILFGGKGDDSVGYFVEPTVIQTTNPHYRSMEIEIFGPVVTVYVYKDDAFEETVELCDNTSPYALCGCIFANDRQAVRYLNEKLRYAAGNYYVNDKSVGAVAGHQPFGGARASGTNDKSGGNVYLLRFTSPRLVKEHISPPHDWKYPFLL